MAVRRMEKKVKEKREKVKSTSKKPKEVALDLMEDAVVEGKIVVPVGTTILTVRPYRHETQKSQCIVMKIEDDLVSCWDETMEYWYCFNPSQIEKNGIVVKVIKRQQ